MGANGGMSRRRAQPIDCAMGESEIDLARSLAGLVGRKTELTEDVLCDPVVSLVLDECGSALGGKACLPPVTDDKIQPLQRCKMGQRGRSPHLQARRNQFERDPPLGSFTCADIPKGVQLSAGELLQGFHTRAEPIRLFM